MAEPVSFGWLFVKTIVAMVFIIGLALISIKYLLPRVSGVRGRSNSRIKVLDVQPLEMRKSVYIVEIDGRQVALGVSEQSVNFLCDIKNTANHATGGTSKFEQQLASRGDDSYKPKA